MKHSPHPEEQDDLLRPHLIDMIDGRRELAKLAGVTTSEVFEREWSGLPYFQHAYQLSDEAVAIVFRTREQFVNKRTELVNALRAYPYEFGYVMPQGIGHLRRLPEIVAAENTELANLLRDICGILLNRIAGMTDRLETLKKTIDALSNATMPKQSPERRT